MAPGTDRRIPSPTRAAGSSNRLPGSRFQVFYSRPAASDRVGLDYTAAGRLSVDAFGTLGLPRDAEAYLCGPADFMALLTAGLVEYGLDAARIHSETFGAAAALTPGHCRVVVDFTALAVWFFGAGA